MFQSIEEIMLSSGCWESSRNIVPEVWSEHLVQEIEELRFKILFTIKCEQAQLKPSPRRQSLRNELAALRDAYMHAIDQLAMISSVEEALKIRQEIESKVQLPDDMQFLIEEGLY